MNENICINGTECNGIFQQYELDSFLGDYADQFDIDGIIDESTIIDYKTGTRYWVANIDLDEICKRNERCDYRVRWTIPGSGNIDGDEFATLEEARECFDTMCRDGGRDAKIVDLLTVYGDEDGDIIITNRHEFGGAR